MALEYELFYLVGEKKDAELPRIKEEVEALVVGVGGTFLPAVTEEKRKMAYEIKDEIRGTYIARRFTLPDKDEIERGVDEIHPIVKIERALTLSKDVLRSLVLRADELPELKAIEREERPVTDKRLGRGERQRTARVTKDIPMIQEKPAPAAKEVSTKEIDQQLESLGI